MPTKIKAIHIHALRGIRDLNLDLNGKSLVLKGDNGMGKSSIVDALEFFFTGRVAHLQGIEGVSNKKHLPHVNFDTKDLAVELRFDPGNILLKRTFKGISKIPGILKEYFEEGVRGNFILRRAQILEFINSQPSDRYRSLGNIIGIGDLDESELQLKRVCDELQGRVESTWSEDKRILQEISELLKGEIAGIDDALSQLNSMLKQKGLPTIDSLTEMNDYARKLLPKIRATVNEKNLASINAMRSLMDNILIPEELVQTAKDLNPKINQFISLSSKPLVDEHNLLEMAKDVIAERELDECPVCEQPINRNEVLKSLSDRIRLLMELTTNASNLRTSVSLLRSSFERNISKLEDLYKRVEGIDKISVHAKEVKNIIDKGNRLSEQISLAGQLNNPLPIDDLLAWKNRVGEISKSLQSECEQLLNDIKPTEEEKNIIEAISLVERISDKLNRLAKIQRDLKVNNSSLNLAQNIYSAFSDAKKQTTYKVYSEIQTEITNAYIAIHHTEPIGGVELTVEQRRRASTKLNLELFGKKGDPRALSSEGHLDSLGLCIFLAFIKRFNSNFGLMVLDDVVTSIDSRHRSNIAKLIIEESKDRQIIITTHDEVWFKELRACQETYGLGGNFVNDEIINWDINTGPQLRRTRMEWEEIDKYINEGDKGAAGNKARQYLERVLKEACSNIQAKVQYKEDGRYEVGDLFDPARSTLLNLARGTRFKEEIATAFNDLSITKFMSNVLSHDNELQGELSTDEVRSFCNAVHKLDQVLSCPTCHSRLIYDKQSRVLRCSSERCKDPIRVNTS
jgi:energy-coupling factor transporter ATP-binding protein EcfA2